MLEAEDSLQRLSSGEPAREAIEVKMNSSESPHPIDKPNQLKYLNGGDNSNSNVTATTAIMTTTEVENSTRPLLQRNDYNLLAHTVADSPRKGDNQLMTVYLNGGVTPPDVDKKIDEDPNGNDITSNARGVFHQILVTGAVLLLAAACGMPIGYSAVLLPQLYNMSEPLVIDIEMGSWIASVHSLATPIGSFASGPIMDHWGRKPALLAAIVPLFSGWIFLATASSHFLILVGRVVAGISVGLIAAPAQVLLAEIAEPRLRGLLIGAPFVSYSMGILLVYALGSYFHWRHVAWAGTILPLFSFVAIMFMPETPVFLARNNQLKKASRALTWLRGCPIQAKRELQQLVDRTKTETEESANQSLWQTLTKVSLVKPLIIINGFHILQILSGTYLVVFYAVDIISDMGGSDINSLQAAVLTAAVRLAFTFLYCFLLLTMPRRMMVIGSGIGSGISCLAIAIFMYIRLDAVKTPMDTYVAAIFILIYIGTNTGFMTMPGIMIGELLPAKIRGRIAGNLFTIFNLLLFGVAKGFLYAKQIFKTQGLFLIFGVASFGASLLLYLMLPETKGRTLHDIEDYFQRPNWLWITRKRTAEEERRRHPKGSAEAEEGVPLKAIVRT